MINRPENQGLSNAARIALAMYEGEPCRICGKPITNAADAVFVGYSADNKSRAAHEKCALAVTETVERQRQVLASLDMPIRRAIAFIQAFSNHHKYPDTFGVPDLDDAASAWRDLSDAAIRAFEE